MSELLKRVLTDQNCQNVIVHSDRLYNRPVTLGDQKILWCYNNTEDFFYFFSLVVEQ